MLSGAATIYKTRMSLLKGSQEMKAVSRFQPCAGEAASTLRVQWPSNRYPQLGPYSSQSRFGATLRGLLAPAAKV
jgi:hypothetical protein